VQAAASARVADDPEVYVIFVHGILNSAKNGDGASVLCHLIADVDSVNAQDH
jgi:hypothetical protein